MALQDSWEILIKMGSSIVGTTASYAGNVVFLFGGLHAYISVTDRLVYVSKR